MISNLYRRNTSAGSIETAINDDSDGRAVAYTPDEAARNNLEKLLLETIGNTLSRYYPRPEGLVYWWAIEINGSVVNIFNLALSGRWGYTLHTQGISTEKVVRAGGEILERYGVPRDYRRYSAAQIVALHDDSPTRFLQHHA